MKLTGRVGLLVFLPVLAGCPAVIPPVNTIDDASLKAAVLRWNKVATDANALDHTPPAAGETRTAFEAGGPTGSSRALAITHIAIFDAMNAVAGGFQSYTRTPAAETVTSVEAAIAQAARDTLVALYPSQADIFNDTLDADLAAMEDGAAKDAGVALGQDVAAAILTMRENDGSQTPVDYVFSDAPGAWRQDPINPTQQPIGEEWFQVKPFVMNSATQFRAPAPPALDSPEYAAAFDEVQRKGGDRITTTTDRTPEEEETGFFWAYDGVPGLGTPPRLYNQIAVQLADEQNLSGVETARMLALINVSMADACIAVWESKYFYNYWRPVTGIREAEAGTGPTGLGDGNDATVGDPAYVPLCAPASNSTNLNFTPAFPAYPSGHAGFGGAVFETLRNVYGTDDIAFSFMSDELNGVTTDNTGTVRPVVERSFDSLSQAEEENGQSRIYLGIHWSFDKTEGIRQGNQVADFVMANAFQPVE